jgi:lactoylglutathione lyase
MFSQTLLASFALVALLPFSLTCNPPQIATHGTPSPLTIGSDGPAPPATISYTFNHFALLVNNLTATRHFYGDILGMRHIFTFQAFPTYSVMYMCHVHGGKNGIGHMTGAELFTEKDNIEGLIEFVYLKTNNVRIPSSLPLPPFCLFPDRKPSHRSQ